MARSNGKKVSKKVQRFLHFGTPQRMSVMSNIVEASPRVPSPESNAISPVRMIVPELPPTDSRIEYKIDFSDMLLPPSSRVTISFSDTGVSFNFNRLRHPNLPIS